MNLFNVLTELCVLIYQITLNFELIYCFLVLRRDATPNITAIIHHNKINC